MLHCATTWLRLHQFDAVAFQQHLRVVGDVSEGLLGQFDHLGGTGYPLTEDAEDLQTQRMSQGFDKLVVYALFRLAHLWPRLGALEAGTFHNREGSALTWQTLVVDERGWKEIAQIVERGEERVRQIAEKCAVRIDDLAGEIPIVVALAAFEAKGYEKEAGK